MLLGFKFGKLFVIGSSISMGWFCYLSYVGCRTLQIFVVLSAQLFLLCCFTSVTMRQVYKDASGTHLLILSTHFKMFLPLFPVLTLPSPLFLSHLLWYHWAGHINFSVLISSLNIPIYKVWSFSVNRLNKLFLHYWPPVFWGPALSPSSGTMGWGTTSCWRILYTCISPSVWNIKSVLPNADRHLFILLTKTLMMRKMAYHKTGSCTSCDKLRHGKLWMTGAKQFPYKPTCCRTYVGDMLFIWPLGIELHEQFNTSKCMWVY
jgi:hypothetical protein